MNKSPVDGANSTSPAAAAVGKSIGSIGPDSPLPGIEGAVGDLFAECDVECDVIVSDIEIVKVVSEAIARKVDGCPGGEA